MCMGMLDEECMVVVVFIEGFFDEDVDLLVGGRLKVGLDCFFL